MFAFVVYAWPKRLSECWQIPIERAGFRVEPLPDGGVIRTARSKARLLVGRDDSATIYGWSLFPWKKSQKIAESVERILMASGMQAFCQPHTTNIIYRTEELPNRRWIEKLKQANVKIASANNTDDVKNDFLCGRLQTDQEFIQFWTGPAIDSETKQEFYYIALRQEPKYSNQTMQSLHSALIQNKAVRLIVQRNLDR